MHASKLWSSPPVSCWPSDVSGRATTCPSRPSAQRREWLPSTPPPATRARRSRPARLRRRGRCGRPSSPRRRTFSTTRRWSAPSASPSSSSISKSSAIYYVDADLYPMHKDFIFAELLKMPRTKEAEQLFDRNYGKDKPDFLMCYLVHHLEPDIWTLAFWDGDKATAAHVRLAFKRMRETFYLASKVKFRPNSNDQEAVAAEIAGDPEHHQRCALQGRRLPAVPQGNRRGQAADRARRLGGVRARRDRDPAGAAHRHHARRRDHLAELLDAARAREHPRGGVGHPERRLARRRQDVCSVRRKDGALRGRCDERDRASGNAKGDRQRRRRRARSAPPCSYRRRTSRRRPSPRSTRCTLRTRAPTGARRPTSARSCRRSSRRRGAAGLRHPDLVSMPRI